jgi:hypothetical protein
MARAPYWLPLLALLTACCPQLSARSSFSARASLADERRASTLAEPIERPRPLMVGRVELPNGRAISQLGDAECRRILRNASVRFDQVPRARAKAIRNPVELASPILGVRFAPANGMATNGIVDCRLAAAFVAWAPILRDAGVVRVEHFSTYRPGARVAGSGKVSGHAHALAIDAARFHMRDGRVIEVEGDWDERERGGSPCPVRRDESEKGRILRAVVCRAVERDLFQVVLTPHYDRAHFNHVHMELVPTGTWSFIH